MIIGITGNFGTGKTAVANIFRRHGFEVIDVDKLYYDDFYKNHPLRKEIEDEFGTLDREKLKKIVFNDYSKLKKLNKITHPIIIKKTIKEIETIIEKSNKKIYNINKNSDRKIKNTAKIIIDIPLLFEAKLEKMFDSIIVVKCNEKTQIERILAKNKKYTEKEIKQIMKSQMPLKEKIKKADFVVDNSRTLKNSENQAEKIIKSIQAKALKTYN